MAESLFQHYVVNGGWAMLALIPASVVCVSAIVRGFLLVRRRNICPAGGDPEQAGCAARVVARLGAIRASQGKVSAEDVRAEIAAETMDLFSALQPLAAMYVLAPLVGMLGSVTAVMAGNAGAARGMPPAALAAVMERALVPLMWGLGIALVAYAGFAWLRARLYILERTALVPCVEAAVASWQGGKLPSRRGFSQTGPGGPGGSGKEL